MILWIKAEAAQMPVDQRAKLQEVKCSKDRKVTLQVMLLGPMDSIEVKPEAICGVELCRCKRLDVDLKFTFKGVRVAINTF